MNAHLSPFDLAEATGDYAAAGLPLDLPDEHTPPEPDSAPTNLDLAILTALWLAVVLFLDWLTVHFR